MSEDNTADCAVGVLLDLQTPEKKPPRIIPSTYTKPEKPVEDGHDHESSFTISAPGDIDLPVNVSNIKRVLNENINDSIEVRREETIGAERCITPGEVPVHEGVIKLLDDEQFDFDIPFSPALKKKTSREPSPSENAPGDDDDEIFFGPMGHTEKCVSKAVEDVIQEEEMIKPLSPLNPKQMAELFKEAHRVVYHIEATAPKGSESSVESENSVPARTLNFSNLSVNDSVSSVCTTDISAHFSPPRSPRQRKNTFTKEESALDNLSEALNKALPNVEPLQRDKNGALKFSACGQRKAGEAKSGGFARGSAIRRSLPISMGRGLKPVGIKTDTGRKPQGQQTYLKRSSVGKCEKRQRHDSGASTDDAMSIASNDSEASWCTLPSGKRGLPQPKLKPSSSGLKPPGQSRLARPARPHSRSNTIHTPGSTSRPKAESRIDCKPTPTRRSLGSQPMGSKLSLPRSKLPGDSGLQKPISSLSKPANKPAASTTSSRISTTRLSNSKSQSSLGSVKGQQSSAGSKLAAQKSGIPGKSPVNMTVTKPSGLTKPAIKGTMTKLDNLKPGTMQRKQVVGSKLGAPGAGPLKATGLSRPGGNKTTQRLTPKEPVANKSKMAKENTPERPIPKPSSGTVTKSTSGTGTHKVPILTTPVKAEKNVQPKRLTLQDTTNRTPRKSDSSLSSIGTPVSAVKRRSFLPTPNKTLSISSVDSDLGKGVGGRTGSTSSQGSDPSPAVGMLVDIGFGTIPDTPTAFMAKPKVLSTPQANKENQPKSIWSPVRKPRMALEDEVIQCTKRFSVYQKK